MAMKRRLSMALALSVGLSVAATAQQSAGRPWPVDVAHYAKWPGLAATGTMFALGFLASRDAAGWRDSLTAYCADPAHMDLDGDNECMSVGVRYVDPAAQALHEARQDADDRAQKWILGGELALVTTGAMFLLDLIHRDGGPQNIPFTPFRVYASRGRLGLSARF